MMVTAMENAALNAVRDYLDPGESAVGTLINVRHLAATPVGHQVTAEAEVTKVDGRRIEFPAQHLRPFVAHGGISGYFEIEFDQTHRFRQLRRVDEVR